jgi:hypothetical protein
MIFNSGSGVSCRNVFKKLSILPFQSQYIFSLLMFVVKNKDFFKLNSDFHTFNTRSKCDLHFPVVNLFARREYVALVLNFTIASQKLLNKYRMILLNLKWH